MSRVDHLVVIHSKSGEGAFRGMIPKASGENGNSPAVESLCSMQKLCQEPGRKTAIPCRSAASQRQGSSGAGGRGSAVGGKQLETLLSLLSTEFNPWLPGMATCIF